MSEALSKTQQTARVTEWKENQGYGWLQCGDRRVFLHRRDYSGNRRSPDVGEEVHFIFGQDAQGRPCARNAVSTRSHGAGLLRLWFLAPWLVLPAIALERVPVEAWKIVSGALAISLITYTAYASDKRRARTKAWRIPEAHLHLLELCGGWPGAWLAQQQLRHKCSKRSYQSVFWLIILTHQFIAFDSLQNWRFSEIMLNRVTEMTEHLTPSPAALSANGAEHASPGQRPGDASPKASSPEGAEQPLSRPVRAWDIFDDQTQDVALGWLLTPLWG